MNISIELVLGIVSAYPAYKYLVHVAEYEKGPFKLFEYYRSTIISSPTFSGVSAMIFIFSALLLPILTGYDEFALIVAVFGYSWLSVQEYI